ncbi:hypothetical protein [Rhodoferax saidenbachensis]|uniref:FRG domain-containing protein n=1 Tax=Rhodoferax saidenbachensis TaxID=1484693 RepID=A0ABU1ZMN7_9BURK|nr:hypothetical protein [Rhodoferax saidenbachensis]MDR7306812.1 hypothetical protein [Rhodoferax saidenbachensis]
MTDSALVALRRDTIHRQAKRFSEKLGLPQTTAKKILARALYRCTGWDDLYARLGSQAPEKHIELLTALPHSIEARTYFFEIRNVLVKSLSQHVLINRNLVGLHDLVQDIFALGSDPTILADILPMIAISAWQPSGLGPDPWAVLEAEAMINGIELRLLATRTYMPKYYDFHSDTICPEYAEPFDGKFKIIWTDPDAWRQAALDYLNDEDADDIQLPQVELTPAMAQHQEWFEASLGTCGGISGEYGQHGEDFIPHLIENRGCYIIFGFPSRLPSLSETANQDKVTLLPGEDSIQQVGLIGETPVCLEWIAFNPATQTHPGENYEYFESLRNSLFRNGQLHTTSNQDGIPGILFLQPATDFDIRHALKVEFTSEGDEIAFVLQTDDSPLVSALLEKVAARDLMVFGSKENPRYFCKMQLPLSQEPPTLSVSLRTIGAEFFHAANLVFGKHSAKRDGGWQFLIEVSPKLLTLQDKLGKKAMETAINHGLVLRYPVAFKNELEKPPSRCEHFPRPSEDIVKLIEARPRGPFRFGYTQYKRDNF